jgi:hypothetical protein
MKNIATPIFSGVVLISASGFLLAGSFGLVGARPLTQNPAFFIFLTASLVFLLAYILHGLRKWGWLVKALFCAASTMPGSTATVSSRPAPQCRMSRCRPCSISWVTPGTRSGSSARKISRGVPVRLAFIKKSGKWTAGESSSGVICAWDKPPHGSRKRSGFSGNII